MKLKTLSRVVLYLLAFLIPPLVVGAIGINAAAALDTPGTDPTRQLSNIGAAPPHDPNKLTVAVLLGDDLTEVTDFLVPYEVFAASGALNVYAVAPERKLTTLTGGLDVLPQLSLAEFDAEVGNPDVIVVPHIPNIERPENQRLLEWLRRHADGRTVLLSICTGAGELAATGLLDGREATTHWGDIGRLEKTYPEVRWVRGVRYVDDGDIVSSAGLTSGIDASLHVLARFEGLEAARRVARKLNYPNFRFVISPAVEQYTVRTADAIYLLNAAYRWDRAEAGVLLRDGVGEFELASIFDSYGASATTKLVTATPDGRAVRSEHGLQLIPRSATENLKTDKLLVPGREDAHVSGRTPATWIGGEGVTYLHVNSTRFAFNAPLENLAQQRDVATATFAARRLEIREESLQLEGRTWPLALFFRPLIVGLLGVGLVAIADRALSARRLTQLGNRA